MSSSGPIRTNILWALFCAGLLAGCAASPYPLERHDLLDAQIVVRMPEAFQVKPEEEFVADVLYRQHDLLPDELSRSRAVKYIRYRYRNDFAEKPVNPNELFEQTIHQHLANDYSYMAMPRGTSVPRVKMAGIASEWSGEYGKLTASLEAHSSAKHDSFVMTDLTLGVKRQTFGGATFFAIQDISYRSTCVFPEKNHQGCRPKDYASLDEKALLQLLRTMKPAAGTLPPPSRLRNEVQASLKNRYYPSRSVLSASPTTRKYATDFALAIERMRSRMEDWTYDGNRSAFIAEMRYDNPAQSNKSFVIHRYIFTVQPDRNGTVVEISGQYHAFRDSLGGEDKYGTDVFYLELTRKIAQLDDLLQ